MFKYSHLRPLLIFLLTFTGLSAISQPVLTSGFQANINKKPSAGNNVSFRIRPVTNTTTGFTTMDFSIRVPISQGVTFGAITQNTTNFPGVNVVMFDNGTNGIYHVYEFLYSGTGTTSRAYAGGNSYEVFSVATNVDPLTVNIELAHEGTETNWWFALGDLFGADMMPKASGVLQPGSYFYPATTQTGSDFISGMTSILPANLGDFNVQKQGEKGAALDWTTLQEQNVNFFAVERSLSQNSGWTKIAEVKAKGESSTPTKYTFADASAFDGIGAKTVFYRIRSIDLDGKELIFPIRSLRFTSSGKAITIYPNPVKDGFTIQIPVLNPADKKIRMNLINQAGQVLNAREISATQAANYYYDIKTPGVIPGEYMLQIILDGEMLDTKKILVQR